MTRTLHLTTCVSSHQGLQAFYFPTGAAALILAGKPVTYKANRVHYIDLLKSQQVWYWPTAMENYEC